MAWGFLVLESLLPDLQGGTVWQRWSCLHILQNGI